MFTLFGGSFCLPYVVVRQGSSKDIEIVATEIATELATDIATETRRRNWLTTCNAIQQRLESSRLNEFATQQRLENVFTIQQRLERRGLNWIKQKQTKVNKSNSGWKTCLRFNSGWNAEA